MAAADIDTLIEEGLTRYGRGDLDGALLVWEEALSVEPENEQATSYVDYVRQNYDLLTGGDQASDEATVPFGIEDDEYLVEIIEGQVLAPAQVAPLHMDPLDDGWFIDEEPAGFVAADAGSMSDASLQVTTTYQIEADEPPMFDSETREFDRAAHPFDGPHHEVERTVEAVRPLPDDDDDEPSIEISRPVPVVTVEVSSGEFPSGGHTPGFGEQPDSTPVGFAAQVTDVRVRDLGFVHIAISTPGAAAHGPELAPPEVATAPPPAVAVAAPEVAPSMPPAHEARPRRGSAPPELKMTIRTPTHDKIEDAIAAAGLVPTPVHEAVPAPLADPPPPTASAFGHEPTASEHTHFGQAPVVSPSLTRVPDETDTDVPPAPRNALAPPDLDDLAPPPSPSALTRELPFDPLSADDRRTRELLFEGDRLTQRFPMSAQMPTIDISAPTRELGMRPTRTDLFITSRDPRGGASDPRSLAAQAALSVGDGTRADIVLPFDPMDARSAQILDDVDEGSTVSESKEDRTRRRITALLERAADWQRAGELDKAVTAIDLALAEDPNSALAQKLIHRNRDTILAGFQAFIGDLQRAPILARPLHEPASAPISPRAAFLLSRVDGTMSIDEILDVSGMPRLEAYRYLCQLLLRGILR